LIQLCFAAYSGEPPRDSVIKALIVMEKLGKLCERFVVIVGGYWGLMKHVVDKALELGLPVVIVTPAEQEHELFPENAIVIKPGASYRVRSVFMVRSCDTLIALGGESGTIQEIVTAYAEGIPVYILRSGFSSDKVELLTPHIDSRALAEVKVFENPEELAIVVSKEVCKTKAEEGEKRKVKVG
jgi:uncharacterized protein (TIGR00725 family)